MGGFGRIRERFFRPVDIAGLAVFRVVFGTMMALDTGRYVFFGWIHDHFVAPAVLFKFYGFTWVEPLPEWGLNAAFAVMAAAGVGIALGLFYRLSCILFFLTHTYFFLLAAEYYLNHGYLISVLALVMAFVPAHRALSFDAKRVPGLYSQRVPAWSRWLLLGLLTIVFTYGGVAKLNADWFAGEPIRHWLADRAATSVVGDVLTSEIVVMFVAYAGTVFDLIAAPMLLWRRTRLLGVLGSIAFHLSNHYLFNIGVFPWMMLAATTLFFEPSWPRNLPFGIGRQIDEPLHAIGRPKGGPYEPALDVALGRQTAISAAVVAFAVIMLLVPLRHHLYPGDVAWTEQGHNFSWRMKLRNKQGSIDFTLRDAASGDTWTVRPEEQLTPRQVEKMIGRPDLIVQYAHILRDAYKHHRGIDVEVRANSFVSLNYRTPQRFIDPSVDLAQRELTILPVDYILPYQETPLPSPVPAVEGSLGRLATRILRTVQRRLLAQREDSPLAPSMP
jgi:hypothetical protein